MEDIVMDMCPFHILMQLLQTIFNDHQNIVILKKPAHFSMELAFFAERCQRPIPV